MNALLPTVGTGVWTQLLGPTTLGFVDNTSPTTAITGAIAGTYQLQWTVSNGNCPISSDTMTLTILSVSDLELTKSVSPTHGSAGDEVTFNIQIFNNNSLGGTVTATGVAVRDYIPTGFTIVPGSANLAGQYNVGDNTLTWYNLTIPNGGRLNLTFKAIIKSTGSTINKAEIIQSDQFDPDSTPNNQIETEDDQDSVSVSIDAADLSLQKTVSPTSVSINDHVVFTIRTTNSGPNNATGVTVLDKLPQDILTLVTMVRVNTIILQVSGTLATSTTETLLHYKLRQKLMLQYHLIIKTLPKYKPHVKSTPIVHQEMVFPKMIWRVQILR